MNVALIAVQLEVSPEVLASGDVYRRHIDDAAVRALAGVQADERFVVFPELAGHLALLSLAPPLAQKAKTLGAALAASAVRRPLEVLRGVASTRVLDPKHAVLAALAPDGERFWRSVFGPLARKHRAYVVAGSHVRLAANGALTNASLLFAPDGRCLATTDKVNLVPGMENAAPGALGLARGDREVPIVGTTFGRVATLICYDGFHVPHTSQERFDPMPERIARRGGVEVVANPAANLWPWTGGWPPPKLASPRSTFSTRAEQWQCEGLPGSLAAEPFARWGVTAQLVGQVLDLVFQGASEVVEPGRVLARSDHYDRGGSVAATVRAKG